MQRIAGKVLLVLICAAFGWAQEGADELQPLMAAGNAAYMRGDYDAARESFAKAWELAQQKPVADPIRYDVLKRLTSVRSAAGEFADADNYLQMAINWRETNNGMSDPKIADDLLISVGLCRGMKNYDRALLVLARVMGIHRASHGMESTTVADDFSRMAQIFLEQKNLQAGINSLKNALEIRTKVAGPLDPSLVPDLDRLAATNIAMRQYETAEGAYRHALVIRETLFGKEDADLIATVDGLAYACFGQKKYDEAEPLYKRLIGLWVKSVGEEHPMVAIALDKVAVFYADQKKFDAAKEATDQATAIRTHFLAAGLSAAATEQTAEDHKEEAVSLYHRALAVMEPPNALYADLRKDVEGLVKDLKPPATKAVPKKTAPKKK
jgi:tetratricopeptide (TPR) repeat protein